MAGVLARKKVSRAQIRFKRRFRFFGGPGQAAAKVVIILTVVKRLITALMQIMQKDHDGKVARLTTQLDRDMQTFWWLRNALLTITAVLMPLVSGLSHRLVSCQEL